MHVVVSDICCEAHTYKKHKVTLGPTGICVFWVEVKLAWKYKEYKLLPVMVASPTRLGTCLVVLLGRTAGKPRVQCR